MATEHFNNLTEAQLESLAILAEECAEIIQIIGKIQRHGLDSYYKDVSNRDNLSQEIVDTMVAMARVSKMGMLLDEEGMEKALLHKLNKNSHLHHAPEVTLEDF